MRTFLKILAILMLVLTIAAAGIVLFALQNRTPKAEVVYASAVQATDASERFEELSGALLEGTYGGRIFTEDTLLEAEDCQLVTLTLRLENTGLLPFEWIELSVIPEAGDILEVRDEQPHVLNARSSGDLSVQLLSRKASGNSRMVEISYYLLGRKMTETVSVAWGAGS